MPLQTFQLVSGECAANTSVVELAYDGSSLFATIDGVNHKLDRQTNAGTMGAAVASAATMQLVTTAGQTTIVIAKGSIQPGILSRVVALKYDGVTQDSVNIALLALNTEASFTLTAILSPGAQTKNLTIEAPVTINSPKITVIQFG